MHKLSILIPAYNEIQTIDEILNKIKSTELPLEKEIVIVDDGSEDGTKEFLQSINDPLIKIFFHDRNYGKGRAIRTALANASGDIVIIQDADLEYDPMDYRALLIPILENRAEVVYGNRRGMENMRKSYNRYYWGGRIVTAATNILYRAKIHDEPVCYKVFKKAVLDNITLTCEKFEFCPEVTAKVCKAGYKIHEVPVAYYPRSFRKGKKITWRDGFAALWTLIKNRF